MVRAEDMNVTAVAVVVALSLVPLVTADGGGPYLSYLEIGDVSSPICTDDGSQPKWTPDNGPRTDVSFTYTVEPTYVSPPAYYFIAYGKYPSDANWRWLGWKDIFHHSVYVPTSFNQKAQVIVPAPSPPAKGGDSTYIIRIVGYGCKGLCWWPGPENYEVKADREETALFIREIKVIGTPDAARPETGNTVKLEAKLSNDGGARVTWTGTPLPPRTKKSPHGDNAKHPTNPKENGKPINLDYKPKVDTHGNKQITAQVEWNVGGRKCTGKEEKKTTIYFQKTKKDHGEVPNWFLYWPEGDDGAVNPAVYNNVFFSHQNAHTDKVYSYVKEPQEVGRKGMLAKTDPKTGETTVYDKAGFEGTHPDVKNGYNVACGGQNLAMPPMGKGIDLLSKIICHERLHVWVFDQWAKAQNVGGWNQLADTDCDGIPDVEEIAVAACFDPTKHDSFPGRSPVASSGYNVHNEQNQGGPLNNCQNTKSSNHDEEIYITYLCRTEQGIGENDWGNPGRKATGYFREENPETGENASFTGVVTDRGEDADLDSYFDFLVVSPVVQVESAGTYTLYGLLDNGDQLLGASNETVLMDIGNATLDIRFDGLDIHQLRSQGEWNVTLTLLGMNLGEDLIYTIPSQAYSLSSFEPPSAGIAGVEGELATDVNTNGQYDILTISVRVNVTAEATYVLSGGLETQGISVAAAENASLLPAGTHVLALDFPGRDIRAQRMDGPYSLRLEIRDEQGNQTDLLEDSYNTSPYVFTQFEQPLAEFTGTVSDLAEDTNSNGFFDALVISADVTVLSPGTYSFLATLMNVNATTIGSASPVLSLQAGAQRVQANFSGLVIAGSGFDGPYLFSLALHDDNGSVQDSLPQNRETAAYAAAQFEPPATLGGTVTDTSGGSLPDVGVRLLGPATGSATTDSVGSFSFPLLPEGNYTLEVVPPLLSTYGRFSNAVSLPLGSSEFLNISLAPAGIIRGRITDQNGAAASAAVSASFLGPWHATDENGTYVIPFLQESEQRVEISSGAWYIFVNGEFYGFGSSAFVPVVAGEIATVDFTQQLPASCVDNDGDGFFSGCSVFPDCDDANSTLIGLKDGLLLSEDKVVCLGTYHAEDSGDDGIVIFGASGISLDCSGSVLRGSIWGTGTAFAAAAKDNISLANCSAMDYDTGISFLSTTHAVVRDFSASDVYIGISLEGGGNNTIAHATIEGAFAYSGIYLSSSHFNILAFNTLIDQNGGIILISSNSNTLANNTAIGNSYGIELFSSPFNRVANNTLLGSYTGVWLSGSHNTTVEQNRQSGGSYGMRVSTSLSAKITSNSWENNTYRGMYLYRSSGSNITGNMFMNPLASYDLEFTLASDSNSISNNSFLAGGVRDDGYGNVYCSEPRNVFAPGASQPYGALVCDCVDADADGTFAFHATSCVVGNDCNDSDPAMVGVVDNVYLRMDTEVCPGTYMVRDFQQNGIFIFNASAISLDCSGASVTGQGEGSGVTSNGFDGIGIANCALANYRYGILLWNTDRAKLAGLTLSGGDYGIYLQQGANTTISDVTSTGNDNGIYLQQASNTTISDVTSTGNGNGIYLYSSSNTTVTGSTINSSTAYGLLLSYSSTNVFRYNSIINAIYDGIRLEVGQGNLFEFNNVHGNLRYNFYNNQPSNVSAERNWWGSTDPAAISLTIYDYFDNPSKGIVSFAPWLNGSVGNGPPVLSPVGNRTIGENQTLAIQLTATDPDNDTLLFGTDAASVLPSVFSFDENTGLFEWTPTLNDSGIYLVLFNVSDGELGDEERIAITVQDAGQTLACGARVSTNVLLGNDLLNCTGDGLTVVASGVTLDCNGHLLSGDGGAGGGIDAGINVTGVTQATIRNCVSTRFDHGIWIEDAREALVEGNTFSGNGAEGVYASNTTDSQFLQNTIRDNGVYGIELIFGSHRNRVEGNVLERNLQGVRLYGAENTTVRANNVSGHGEAGIQLLQQARGSLVVNNTVMGNAEGIRLSSGSTGSLVTGNSFGGNGYGAYLEGGSTAANTFWDNRFEGNGVQAYEASTAANRWNTSLGNFWSDFPANPGYPFAYIIPGPGPGIDFLPQWSGPPVITSSPRIKAAATVLYTYDVEAFDPDNNTLAYSLLLSPPNMTINPANGLVQWIPPYDTAAALNRTFGQNKTALGYEVNVTIQVWDGALAALQAYTLFVGFAKPI